jgi:predicted homoserine dehydrogenase-like protein
MRLSGHAGMQARDPIRVAIVGAGYFGAGLTRVLAGRSDCVPVLVANRTLERAVAALRAAGRSPDAIVVTRDAGAAGAAIHAGRAVASDDLLLATRLAEIEVVAETTGDVLVGATVAQAAFAAGQHVVAANPEAQATLGPMLKILADRAGVVYSDVDGDEPGLLARLIVSVQEMGLEVVVAGNCKGVLKRRATPASQAAFAFEHGLRPWIASAAADGTKLNLELTVVANATGLAPRVQGMHGPRTSPERLLDDLERTGLLDGGHYVDYVLGLGGGVFVVAVSHDPVVQRDLRYLKLGDGPYYLFHDPRVLIHYTAPRSLIDAVRHGAATVAPRGEPVAETIAFAKQDLQPSAELDGIGGFDCYGLIVTAERAQRERLLPIGLAAYARLRWPVNQDEPIGLDQVELTSNLATQLWQQQCELFPARELVTAGRDEPHGA